MSMAEIAAGLRAVVNAATEQRSHLTQLMHDMGEARNNLQTMLRGSSNPRAGQAVMEHAQAVERLSQTAQLLAGVVEAITAYARAIGISIDSGTSKQATSPRSAASWVQRAARELPDRPDDQGPTRGIAFDDAGRTLTPRGIVSGKNIASTQDLKPLPGMAGWPWTLTDHVESAVAADMRKPHAPQRVTLVLNNPPCEQGRFACRRTLPQILPRGSALTIYVTDPDSSDGVRFYGTYEGTGRALRTAQP